MKNNLSKKLFPALTFILLLLRTASAQEPHKQIRDSVTVKYLDSVFVSTQKRVSDQAYLPEVAGMHLFSGKKTNDLVINLNTPGLQQNLGRLSFSKIPGLTMWEMDGAGTQLNIGSRGTDPHRSIEMNMRQNGYATNSDLFGYPENHYSVPLQAIKEVQLVRGSAALQFGPQFGGMMNFKIKDPDTTKVFGIESEQTTGSNNFFNSYNAISGKKGKFGYYAYFDSRHGDGWRKNAGFNYHAYYLHTDYRFGKKASLALEFSRMDYVQKIAGGLTDAQFNDNPKQSFRSRNYFQPVINIPAVILSVSFSTATQLKLTSNMLFGERSSVQFINPSTIKDTFNSGIGSYNPRQVDRDFYNGFATEARLLHHYNLGSMPAVLSAGLRYSNQLTKRKQKGVGTTGDDFDLSLTGNYGIKLRMKTFNYAVFAENCFHITPLLSLTPGFRYEVMNTSLSGVINNATAPVLYKGNRNFPLFGAGLQYQLNPSAQLYANLSQEYRPYLYSNITPADRIDKIDPFLKDSKGYDADLGYRGRIKNILQFDLNAFCVFYGNKVGLISAQNANGTPYLFTTNIGNSVAKGVEFFGELALTKWLFPKTEKAEVKLFNSLSYDHATYVSGEISHGGINENIAGNFVENAPLWIEKAGVQASVKSITWQLQYSYTSHSYNDVLNTVSSTNGVTGEIPAYHVWDFYINWEFSGNYHLSATVNNLADAHYFNRRITFYPGPGILPADGRTFNISLGVNM